MIIYVDVDDTLVRSFGSKQIAMTATQNYVRQLKQAGATLSAELTTPGEWPARPGWPTAFLLIFPNRRFCWTSLVQDWELQQLHPNECRSNAGDGLLEKLVAGLP